MMEYIQCIILYQEIKVWQPQTSTIYAQIIEDVGFFIIGDELPTF